ncbi:hypothetical protein SALBM311S_03685 [Streptomyces alboniger]
MNRISTQEMPNTDRSNALCVRRPGAGPCAAASRVRGPVARTTAVALPVTTPLPWKHRYGTAKAPSSPESPR